MTGRFHRHSAAGWAECTVAGPGRVCRHASQFSERSSTPLIGHARVALSGVLTRLPSAQTDDTQRGGKGHKLLPTPYLPCLIRKAPKGNRREEIKGDGTRCVLRTSSPHVGLSPSTSPPRKNKQKLDEEEGELATPTPPSGRLQLSAIVMAAASRQGCCLRLIACCQGEGRARRTLHSSSGPTSVVFNLVYGRPYPAHRLQALLLPLPVFVCISAADLV